MLNPWAVVLLAVIAMLLIVRLAAALIGAVADHTIGSQHRAAQTIIETGKAPRQWRAARSLLGENAHAQDIHCKAAAMARLDRLIAHFETSSLVADEETRRLLLQQLHRTRQEWQDKSWGEIA